MNDEAPTPSIDALQQKLDNMEAYIEGLEEVIDIPICMVTPQGVITDTNSAFNTFLGADTERILQSKLAEWTNVVSVKEVLDNAGASKQIIWVTDTGQKRKKASVIQPWKMDGDVNGYFIAVKDTDSKALESTTSEKVAVNKKFLQQHIRTQAIVYNIADGIIVINSDNTVDVANPRALDILGMRASDILEKNISDLTGNSVIKKLVDLLEEPDCNRKEVSIEPNIYLEVTIQRVGREPDVTQTILILHDVSEKRMIEDMKLQFASVAAHQMRTPLSTIRWSLEILSEEIEADKLQNTVQRGYKSVQQVLKVVDELLNVDRLGEGESAYSFEPLNVIELIEGAIEAETRSGQVIDQPTINFQEPTDHVPDIRGDESKLKIVFENLIENAVKYTDPDGEVEIRVNIKVTSGYAGDSVVVAVEDSGIGIPEDEQDKIFTKFYRAENATDKQTEGTGVGLFITKRIVEAHNGDIWFESESGEGTTFFVQLPIASEN